MTLTPMVVSEGCSTQRVQSPLHNAWHIVGTQEMGISTFLSKPGSSPASPATQRPPVGPQPPPHKVSPSVNMSASPIGLGAPAGLGAGGGAQQCWWDDE